MPDFFSFEEKYVLEENALTTRAFNIFQVYLPSLLFTGCAFY